MTIASQRRPEPVILDREVLHLPADPYAGFDEEEQKRLNKYLNVRRQGDQWTLSARPRYAGLLNVGSTTYWLEPPFSAASFVYLLLVHQDATEAADRAYSAASNTRNRSISELMRVLAVTMVTEAERLARGHIAQSYVRRADRLGVVRGRPQWHRQAGRPFDGTVLCTYDEKTTDTLENRLVVAGLGAAARWLETTAERAALRKQQFLWRSLAEPSHMARHDFDRADLRLNRLTRNYRPVLALAKALLFGFDLNTTRPNTEVYAPVFDLAALFETLVERVVRTALVGTSLEVTPQTTERRVIQTKSGETYRRIRPDLLLTDSGVPVLVIDSKFKPRYAEGGPSPSGGNRVTMADIFQTFFYSNRLARRHGLNAPVPAAIAAPQVTDREPPSEDYRHIRWGEDGTRLDLLLIPVDAAVAAIQRQDVEFCRSLLAATGALPSAHT